MDVLNKGTIHTVDGMGWEGVSFQHATQNNVHFRGSASFAQELSLTAIQYFSLKKTELSWEFPESLQIFSL